MLQRPLKIDRIFRKCKELGIVLPCMCVSHGKCRIIGNYNFTGSQWGLEMRDQMTVTEVYHYSLANTQIWSQKWQNATWKAISHKIKHAKEKSHTVLNCARLINLGLQCHQSS